MPALHVIAHLAAAVLIVSGAAKLRRPLAVVPSLRRLRLPATRTAARALGAVEVAVGVASLATSHVVAASALATLWVGLLVAAAILLRQGAPDCGCFGAASAPVGVAHLVLNGAFALAAAASVARLAPAAHDIPDVGWLGLATYAVLVATGAAAVGAVLTLPTSLSAAAQP